MSYMFIDGASLEASAEQFGKKWFGVPVELDYRALSQGHQRVFYYHALPSQRQGESDHDFAERFEARKGFFRRLQALDGWHVHFGITRRHKGDKAEQKEVDVLLAVDMLTHVHRRNITAITLLSCDLDFRPLLDAVVREGMYTELIYDPAHTNEELPATADVATPLNFFNFCRYLSYRFRAQYGVPAESNAGGPGMTPSDGVAVAQAIQDGQRIAQLWTCPGRNLSMITSDVPAQDDQFKIYSSSAGHEELLKRVFSEYFGEVAWEAP